jgi:hypothetical protein
LKVEARSIDQSIENLTPRKWPHFFDKVDRMLVVQSGVEKLSQHREQQWATHEARCAFSDKRFYNVTHRRSLLRYYFNNLSVSHW